VPSTVAIVERLPLTRNGKIDRAQLPAVLPDETPARTPRRARDPLEAELVKIWEDVLQVSPIGTDDNFFELGGHSLLAATMIDRVETLFERRVPISALMNGPTIQALATAYWHAEAARGTPLVPVRDQGDRPPLFFVHGDFNGGGLYCSRLARRLDASQPFYVLALHGISNGHVGLSIQSMAAEYADLIRRARPTGPIALGGYCHGALVAFEAARLLSRDREVTNVLMVHPSPVEPRLLTVDRLLRVVTRMRGQDHAAHARTMVRVVMALAFLRRARAADVLGWVVKRVRRAFAPRPPKTDAPAAIAPAARGQIRRHDPALWESVVQAVIAYVPRAYAGSVSLLLPPELGAHAAKGWSRFARHVDVVTVPGDHRTCVTTHVETLGAAIESELAGSQRRQGGTSGPSAAPAN
jgi:thioesterase domain-containing protein/acyl carrier protein